MPSPLLVDPALLGFHIEGERPLTFEVIPRRLEDQGGGLARLDGRLRLVEGLAMPHEADEFALSYYNSLTTWIEIDALLAAFGLTRETLRDEADLFWSTPTIQRPSPPLLRNTTSGMMLRLLP